MTKWWNTSHKIATAHLKKDPTDSLIRKLDNVLKKLLNEQKIDKSFYDSCRTPNPRRPQL